MAAEQAARAAVWVLTRETERSDFIIGAFLTPDDAWAYLGDVNHAGWQAPHGGHQCWRHVDGGLIYRLEHCLLHGAANEVGRRHARPRATSTSHASDC